MKLDEDTKLDVLGMYCIDEGITSDFEPTLIGELINYLIENSDNPFNFLTGEAPNYDEKITFNNLSKFLAARLVKAIEWLNSSQIKEIKYSFIAEQLGYETAEIFLEWIQGK